MRSIPTAANNGQRLQPITGTPIDLLNMPLGCPFAPRCEKALKVCLTQRPERLYINDDHYATCWQNVKLALEECLPQAQNETLADGLKVLTSGLAVNEMVLVGDEEDNPQEGGDE